MKQMILIAIGLISLLPVSAQVLSKEESAKLGNTLENLAREGQRKNREKYMAKQRKEQQRAAEVENRTQLGLQQNKQQVQRLQENYGVDDLRQRNGESRPQRRNIQKAQISSMQRSTPTGNDGREARGNGRMNEHPQRNPGQRPCIEPPSRVPRTPRVPIAQAPVRRQPVVYRKPLGQFPPKTIAKKVPPTRQHPVKPIRPVNPKQPANPVRPVKPMSEDDFFCPKDKRVEIITWRDIKPGLCTKDAGITAAVMRYNRELMYDVGFVNGGFSTQGRSPLIVVQRGDWYIVKSSRVLRK